MDINFYIVPAALAREVGHGPALLFGYLLAVTNLPSGTCTASFDTIAEDLGVQKRQTIGAWATKLHQKGYIHRQRQAGGGTYAIQIPEEVKVSWEFNVKKPTKRKAPDVAPEVAMYRSFTKRYPKKEMYPFVIKNLSGATSEQVGEAFTAWISQGYNPNNINWTTWVKDGIPMKFRNTMGVSVQAPKAETTSNIEFVPQDEEATF